MFNQSIKNVVSILAAIAFGSLPSAGAFAQTFSVCGDLSSASQGFGPFDYRTASAKEKYLVEGTHFTSDVENLRAGSTSADVGADIAYTLKVFPNHPRALLAMSKLALRTKTPKPRGAQWSIDCYFERAVRWRPDDVLVRLSLGIHLTRSGQKEAARVQLDIAERNPIEAGNFHYNLGLALLDIGDADRALVHAWRAYELGYDLPGLRRRLEKAGKWRDAEK